MPFELQGTLLGLGSIVRLETATASGLFVVLARGAYRPDSERNAVVPRYLVGPHPYGEAPDRETFPILVDEIREVVFEGYTDDADVAFLEDLLDQMEHGRKVAAPAAQFTDALTAIQDVPVVSAEDRAVAWPGGDPFFELRARVSRD